MGEPVFDCDVWCRWPRHLRGRGALPVGARRIFASQGNGTLRVIAASKMRGRAASNAEANRIDKRIRDRADCLQSDADRRQTRTGKPLVKMRIALDRVNRIKGNMRFGVEHRKPGRQTGIRDVPSPISQAIQ